MRHMQLTQKRLAIIAGVFLPYLQAALDAGPDGSEMMEGVREEGDWTDQEVEAALDALWEWVLSKQEPGDG